MESSAAINCVAPSTLIRGAQNGVDLVELALDGVAILNPQQAAKKVDYRVIGAVRVFLSASELDRFVARRRERPPELANQARLAYARPAGNEDRSEAATPRGLPVLFDEAKLPPAADKRRQPRRRVEPVGDVGPGFFEHA